MPFPSALPLSLSLSLSDCHNARVSGSAVWRRANSNVLVSSQLDAVCVYQDLSEHENTHTFTHVFLLYHSHKAKSQTLIYKGFIYSVLYCCAGMFLHQRNLKLWKRM